MTPLPMYLS